MHPAGLRCSSLTYTRYARSSRLAGRAPRRPNLTTLFPPEPLMRVKSVTFALLLLVPGVALAQQPPAGGEAVFARACATCHKPGQTEVPPPDALRAYTPEAILNALTNGKMAAQGATLTTADRVAV